MINYGDDWDLLARSHALNMVVTMHSLREALKGDQRRLRFETVAVGRAGCGKDKRKIM